MNDHAPEFQNVPYSLEVDEVSVITFPYISRTRKVYFTANISLYIYIKQQAFYNHTNTLFRSGSNKSNKPIVIKREKNWMKFINIIKDRQSLVATGSMFKAFFLGLESQYTTI